MGLEKLKSAFSNIEEFSETVEKTTEEVSSNIKTNLSTMVSRYSIQAQPQEVNYINNTKSVGFSANQNSQSPKSLFTGIFDKNMTFLLIDFNFFFKFEPICPVDPSKRTLSIFFILVNFLFVLIPTLDNLFLKE